jgi:endo-alpha-1,4-polygalactosaminidase (GH114 family)
LMESKPVLDAIDAIAKEDLYFGIAHDASANDAADIEWSVGQLRQARKARKKALVVEYLGEADKEKAASARARAEAEGFIIHFAPRDLGQLVVQPPDQAPIDPLQSQPMNPASR